MKLFRMSLALALVLALAIAVTGCSSNKDVAAKVNGEKISLTDLNQQVDQLKKQYPTMFTGSDGEGRLLDFKQRLLDNMINQILIEQAAKKKGINITDADVAAQLKQLKSGFESQAKFDQALKSAGMTEAQLKTQIKQQLITQKLIEKIASNETSPTVTQIQQYYNANKTQFQQAAATRASHILFAAKDKVLAQQVLDQINSGADFATMAKKYSTDTATKDKGGDLGWPSTPYVAEFQAALAKLKVGEVSGLVKTQYGWHIIKATDMRKATTKSLADAKDQIIQVLVQQQKSDAYQKYVAQLRKAAKIDILVAELKTNGSSTASTTTGGQ